MAMNPRTHPRGAPPNFSMVGLPANPSPRRITNALWWLVCMRLRLEPLSENGGVVAVKPGHHSWGSRLPDYGAGDSRTDHSIRWPWDRTGPWWEDYASAHDWTFTRAHSGNYTDINRQMQRVIKAMKDPNDPRPDDVWDYVIGNADGDRQIEGYNERRDDDETGDITHLFHEHDSFRRNIIGLYMKMWQALTIHMGWTVAEWRQSIRAEHGMTVSDFTDDAEAEIKSAAIQGVLNYTGGGLAAWAGMKENRNLLNQLTEQFKLDQQQTEDISEMETDLDAIQATQVVQLAVLNSLVEPIGVKDPEQHPLVGILRYVLANPTPPSS